MKFRQVTANKYIGQAGYNLIRMKNGRFAICKGSTIAKWGTGFQTVKSAEFFLAHRDITAATESKLPINDDDLDFVSTVYGAQWKGNNQLVSDTFTLTIPHDFYKNHQVKLKANVTGDPDKMIDDIQQLLVELDALADPVFSSVTYRGTELRSILAKSTRRSSRHIVKDLIRVKSSNIWSYGVEVKDKDFTVGDVYVQFKGKNGGPDDVYKYYDVPVKLWRKFVGAPSKGAFLWKYLRNNFYYSKLTGDKKGVLPNAVN